MLTFSSPAKLNLFLHITSRRDNGYHNLQSYFMLLDYGDTLHFRPDDGFHLTCNNPELAVDGSNLIVRAAELLRPYAKQSGINIELVKRLPMGGGLGGGSSNAATTLLALNHLWQCQLSVDELASLGLQLGADVPFFIRGQSAWVEGVGDQISSMHPPEGEFIVVYPNVFVSTARIFNDERLTRNTPISKLPASSDAVLTERFRNDCQPVAEQLFSEIADALHWLNAQTGNARMTGTGACCFSRLSTAREGQQLLNKLPQHWTGFVARGLAVSPLLRELERSRQT